jgi:hypothetical protein
MLLTVQHMLSAQHVQHGCQWQGACWQLLLWQCRVCDSCHRKSICKYTIRIRAAEGSCVVSVMLVSLMLVTGLLTRKVITCY